MRIDRDRLEGLYARCNHRAFVHPDPLEFLYAYDDPRDREIVGLIASSLAYGRVLQVLKSISSVLEPMTPCPSHFLLHASEKFLFSRFSNFKHRFSTGEELVRMLIGVKQAFECYGSLHACFATGLSDLHDTVLPALSLFVDYLCRDRYRGSNSLLPRPSRGSACKRLNLFLRWMVRKDAVDPGGWDRVSLSKLIVPLDTHMHRISLALGLTDRRQADMSTALEITRAFAKINPEDPARYDFSLTRLGIRSDMHLEGFLKGL